MRSGGRRSGGAESKEAGGGEGERVERVKKRGRAMIEGGVYWHLIDSTLNPDLEKKWNDGEL